MKAFQSVFGFLAIVIFLMAFLGSETYSFPEWATGAMFVLFFLSFIIKRVLKWAFIVGLVSVIYYGIF